MMKMKKFLSMLLAVTMILTMNIQPVAAEVSGDATSQMTTSAEKLTQNEANSSSGTSTSESSSSEKTSQTDTITSDNQTGDQVTSSTDSTSTKNPETTAGKSKAVKKQSAADGKDATKKAADTDLTSNATFEGEGGSYTLDYILKHYNVFTRGDVSGTHIVGNVAVGGKLLLSSSNFGTETSIPKASTFIKGKSNINPGKGISTIYMGKKNEVKKDNDRYVVNGSHLDADKKVYINDNYINFDQAMSELNSRSRAIASDPNNITLTSDEIKDKDGYNNKIYIQAGGRYTISAALASEITKQINSGIYIKGDSVSGSKGTVINFEDATSIEVPNIHFQNADGSWSCDNLGESGAGNSIVLNFPNASKIVCRNDYSGHVGHIIAPNATVDMQAGNYSGTIIADSITGNGEGHMWPYAGDELVPTKAGFVAQKYVDDKPYTGNVQFDFNLFELQDGSWKNIGTVQNSGDQISFGQITYNQAGTHYYLINENAKEGTGFTTSKELYVIKVDVTTSDAGNKTGGTTTTCSHTTTYYQVKDGVTRDQLIQGGTVDESKLKALENGQQPIFHNNKQRGSLVIEKKAGSHTNLTGKTFYFTIKDDNGNYVKNPDNKKNENVWVLNYGENDNKITVTKLVIGRYTVSETDKDGNALGDDYNYDISISDKGKVSVASDKTTNVTVTNTQKVGNLKVTKKVLGSLEGGTFYIQIKGKNTGYTKVKAIVVKPSDKQEDATASVTFDNIPIDDYTVTEVADLNGTALDKEKFAYTVEGDNVTVTVTKNETSEATVTNTKRQGRLKITKVVKCDNGGGTFYFKVVNLKGEQVGNLITITVKNGETKAESDEISLEPGCQYQVIEVDKGGNKVGDGFAYDVTVDNEGKFTSSIDNVANVTFTNIKKTEISGSKTWDDQNNRDGIRPESITVRLYADGEPTDKTVTTDAGKDWKYAFTNLTRYNADGKEIVYTIKEDKVPDGYKADSDGKNITNTHTPETTSISGSKTWDDNNDQDGVRPKSIIVYLLADGVQIASTTVTANENWSYKFENLPKYRAGKQGEQIVYTVSEEAIEDYVTTIDGYNIKNTHIPGKTSVTVDKIWIDHNDQDGVRPKSIQVQLYANGVKSGDPVELNEANKWTYTWNDLPEKQNGKTVKYTVKEVTEDSHYTVSQTQNGNVVTINNTHIPETTVVSGKKIWNDGSDQDGIRPESIRVILYADGKEIAHKDISGQENEWSYSFDNLDKYKDGKEIIYTVKEEIIGKNADELKEKYTSGISGYDITNTHTPEEVEVSGAKTWDDNDDQDGVRPDKIKVTLEADGVVKDTKEVTANDGWSYSWKNLPKYKEGHLINYKVTEEAVPGYTTTYEGYNIKNAHTPGKTGITVRKDWVDNDNQDGKRPDSISVILNKKVGDGEKKEVGQPVELNEENGWSYSWSNLPEKESGKKITYTVDEVSVPDGYKKTITHDGTVFTITNTHTPETTKIEGSKKWDDNKDQDGKRPSKIVVKLYKNSAILVAAKEIVPDDKGNWTFSFDNLPVYENGQKIEYSVTEEQVEGYQTPVVEKDKDGKYIITNTHTPETTSIHGQKTWSDADNQDGKRPSEIEVILLGNGKKVASKKVTEKDNWAYSFDDLPVYENGKEIIYTVAESVITDYTTDINNTNIKNSYTPEKTNISAQKTWDDNDNQDGKRPKKIQVQLYADDEKLGDEVTLSAENDWKYTWDNLDKKKAGKDITYTVKEVGTVKDYTTTVKNVTDNNVTIINKHTPETTEINGKKTWSDAGNQDGIRPASITVNLVANGKTVQSKKVTAKDGWKYSFTNLPVYEDGEKIVYTITENPVDDYTTDIDGYDITNTHTPETVNVKGTKTWNDADDQDGIRPTYINVELYANGELKESKKVSADADGKWNYAFNDLPKFADGKEIKYTIKEIHIDGYTTVIDDAQYNDTDKSIDINITNTHTPETTEVNGKKTWNDENNQDGKRTESVTIRLLADGKEVANKVVTANDQWMYSFTNLPKYANGKEIKYTIAEDRVEGYNTEIKDNNVKNSYTPGKTDFTVTKTWDDNDNQDGIRPDSIQVQLYANKDAYGDPVTLTAAENWTYKWENLPLMKSGAKITYTVKEVGSVKDYTTEVTNRDSDATIVNKHVPETTKVKISKKWDDNNNQDGIRPDSIKVKLLADGESYLDADVTPDADGNWSYTFDNLPKFKNGNEISYTIEEEKVEGYETTIDGYNITNKHVPEITKVSGTKTWNDKDNQDGVRPEKITVNLLKNGKQYKSMDVTEADGWNYSFTDLPKYENGQEIIYTVTEKVVKNYTTEINGTDIKNSYTPGKTSVSVQKIWNDADDQDGKRPGSIFVQLTANGENYGSQVALNAENNWSYTWTDLDLKAAGKTITYKVVEITKIPGYETTVSDPVNNTTVITNKHTPETVEVSGKKTWNDNHDQDGVRPESITVNLLANGEKVQSKKVTAKDNWLYSFKDLPKYKNGEQIKYTVEEFGVPESYTSNTDGYDITNTHIPEVTELNGTKTWNDNNDQDGVRPESITIKLLANGKEVDSRVLTANNLWSYQFKDLPVYENGKKIDYKIEEVNIPEYDTEIVGTNIVNTHTPKVTNIQGEKKWDDNDNQDGVRPEKITVNLLANGNKIKSLIVTESNNWAYMFTNLPVYQNGKLITYTVTEDAVPGYTTEINGTDIKNTHVPETTEISGAKTWNDNDDQDGARPDSITVRLFAGNDEVDSKVVTKADNWKYTFNNLPVYANGKKIVYTVKEDKVEGYKTTVKGYDITNTHTPETTEVSGQKTWDDNDNQDGVRPESITVNLLADGKIVHTKKVTAENNWKYEFKDLPKFSNGKEIAYTVSEEKVTDYAASIDGTNIKNTHKPGKTGIGVIKVWQDNDDQDGIRPDSIKVQLMANGKAQGEPVVLNKKNNWTYNWTDLDAKIAGKEVVYTVEEVGEPEGYVKASSVVGTTVTITNTHKPETTEISGQKSWTDKDNQDGIRPDKITVNLLANGKKVAVTEATEANNFAYTFKDLPKFENGKEIEYTVQEDGLPEGYGVSVDGTNLENIHSAETTEVSGQKKWDDHNNQDGVRPDKVTINLIADGKKVQSTTATKDSDWKYAFKDLPKFNNGKEIVYTVSEENVADYTTKVDGYDITNTHTPGKTGISVNKIWKDNDDQDGIRPDMIRVQLYADGKEVGSPVALSETNNWTYSWTDLDEKNNGKVIEYTVKEVGEIKGYTTTTAKSGNVVTITNTHTPELTEVNGEKTWDDVDDQDGKRPESITVNLLANGTVVKSLAVTAKDGWKYSFKNLSKFENGKEIVYTITEDTVTDYTTEIKGTNIKNSYTPGKTGISVKKVWNDANDQDGKRPVFIQVQLKANGKEVGDPVTLNKDNDWSYSWKDLAEKKAGKTIAYTVEEIGSIEGYISKTETTGNVVTITNSYTPEKTQVSGQKSWKDYNDQFKLRPSSITVNLLADGKVIDSKKVTANDDWKYQFTDLPKYQNGKLIAYTIEEKMEEGADKYTSEVDGDNLVNTLIEHKLKVNKIAAGTAEGLPGAQLVIKDANGTEVAGWTSNGSDREISLPAGTYTLVETKAPAGYKVAANITFTVDAKGNVTVDGKAADQNSVVMKDDITKLKIAKTVTGVETKEKFEFKITIDAPGTFDYEGTIGKGTIKSGDSVYLGNNDEITIYGIPEETHYLIQEILPSGSIYEQQPDRSGVISDNDGDNQVSFENKPGRPFNIPANLVLVKNWDDKGFESERPAQVIVYIKDDKGKTVQTVELSKDNNWQTIVTDLAKLDEDGNEIKYTVEEKAVEGYESQVIFNANKDESSDSIGEYVITNKKKPEETTTPGETTTTQETTTPGETTTTQETTTPGETTTTQETTTPEETTTTQETTTPGETATTPVTPTTPGTPTTPPSTPPRTGDNTTALIIAIAGIAIAGVAVVMLRKKNDDEEENKKKEN